MFEKSCHTHQESKTHSPIKIGGSRDITYCVSRLIRVEAFELDDADPTQRGMRLHRQQKLKDQRCAFGRHEFYSSVREGVWVPFP